MPYPPDYHLHTRLCRHAVGELTDYADQARQKGLTEIGFSDHSPMLRDDFDDWRMRFDQLDPYVAQVRQTQAQHPQLIIKLGLEVDFLPGHEPWIRELAARHPWDYLIGSVHYVSDRWAVDNPAQVSEWKNRPPLEVWTTYFDRLTQAASSGLFDVVGHVDLPKKFGFYPQSDYSDLYRRFLEVASEQKLAIELNTGGLRKDCREIYPSRSLLKLIRQYEIPITFGSDSHAPTEVGMGFDQAIQLAREAGYSHYCRFTGRRRETLPL